MRSAVLLCGCLALFTPAAIAQRSTGDKDQSKQRATIQEPGHVVLETKSGDKAGDRHEILGFSSDGLVLMTTLDSEGGVTGWSATTGEKVYETKGRRPNEMVNSAWPDCGAFVWNSSKSLELRDAGTGKPIRKLHATASTKKKDLGRDADVSPNGLLIAKIGTSRGEMQEILDRKKRIGGRSVVVCDAVTGQQKRAWRLPIPDGNPDELEDDASVHVARLVFSADSKRVAAVMSDGHIFAWDVNGDDPIATGGMGEISWKFNDNGMIRWLPENRGLLLVDSTGLYEWLIESPKAVRKFDLDSRVQDSANDDDGEKKERQKPRKRRGKRQGGNMYPEPGNNDAGGRQAPASGTSIPACISLDGRFAIRLRQKGGLRSASDGGAGSSGAELLDLANRKKVGELRASGRQAILDACIAPQGNAVALELEDGVIHIFAMDEFQRCAAAGKELAAVNPSRMERNDGARKGRRDRTP